MDRSCVRVVWSFGGGGDARARWRRGGKEANLARCDTAPFLFVFFGCARPPLHTVDAADATAATARRHHTATDDEAAERATEDPPTARFESYLLEDGRRVAPEPAGGRRARVGLEAAVRVADGRASHDALAELDDVLALELGKQPLEGQSRDNRETIERQSRDNREIIER